jgi:putative membrane protein
MSSLFSEKELNQIRKAVQTAEETTSAEIVPVFYTSSGKYPDANWKAALFFALLTAFLSFVYFYFYALPTKMSLSISFAAQIIAGILGYFLCFYSDLMQRFFLDRGEVKKKVWLTAESIFLKENVFQTKNRTGMLLFISFFEREAVILGDEGINRIVSPEIWKGIIQQLTNGLKSGNKTDAIIQTIHSMGNLLKQYPIEPNDKNELKDDLRIGGEH